MSGLEPALDGLRDLIWFQVDVGRRGVIWGIPRTDQAEGFTSAREVLGNEGHSALLREAKHPHTCLHGQPHGEGVRLPALRSRRKTRKRSCQDQRA